MSDKKYKIIKSGDKKIAYDIGTSNEVIKILENARANRSFLNIIVGDAETGVSWDETYDTKGVIGLSKGTDYYFPILVSFDDKYEELNEMCFYDIVEFLENNNLSEDDVLSVGGSLIMGENIVAIRVNLNDSDIVYKHPNFKPAYEFDKFKIVEEKIVSNEALSSSIGGDSTRKREYTKFALVDLDGKVYSRHETEASAKQFLDMKLENSLMDIQRMKDRDRDASFDFDR